MLFIVCHSKGQIPEHKINQEKKANMMLQPCFPAPILARLLPEENLSSSLTQ
jgi:hypothetical protein